MRIAIVAAALWAIAVPAQAAPIVVEIFQSQGCSSCPPAIANVNAVADRPDLIVLSFSVTYWDRLGWKDTFAKPAFTERQRDYARGLRHANVYTPQVVINGRSDLVGSKRSELDNAISHAQKSQGPAITIADGRVSISADKARHVKADVWLVRYDPRIQNVAIRAGENGGITLPHKNIVRELVQLGSVSEQAAQFALPPSRDPVLRTAILVQTEHGGPILSAMKI